MKAGAGMSDSTPDWLTHCCQCGRVVDKREPEDGGDRHGRELPDGRWACSDDCWMTATYDDDDSADSALGAVVWAVLGIWGFVAVAVLLKILLR